ncbi:hypothetical protein IG631_12595 [Alternaria alternata]|nr:hypothetical protein IG631_12595 [Alternaria alternata]
MTPPVRVQAGWRCVVAVTNVLHHHNGKFEAEGSRWSPCALWIVLVYGSNHKRLSLRCYSGTAPKQLERLTRGAKLTCGQAQGTL